MRHGSRIRVREVRQAQGGPVGAVGRGGGEPPTPRCRSPTARPPPPAAPPAAGAANAAGTAAQIPRRARLRESGDVLIALRARDWTLVTPAVPDLAADRMHYFGFKMLVRISSYLNRPGYLAYLADINYIYANLKATLPSWTSPSRMD